MGFGDPTPHSQARDRAWRQRSAERYAEKRREQPQAAPGRVRGPRQAPRPPKPTRKRTRRNDGPWRAQCIEAYGSVCIVPGCGSRDIEMDHIKPRGQGGKSVVENGIPLCGAWSKTVPGGHHQLKTDGVLKFEWAWLTPEQRTYLASIGWIDWDEDGNPVGNGLRHFNARSNT